MNKNINMFFDPVVCGLFLISLFFWPAYYTYENSKTTDLMEPEKYTQNIPMGLGEPVYYPIPGNTSVGSINGYYFA